MTGGRARHTMASWARDTEALAPIVEEAEPGFFEHRAMLGFRALAAIYVAGIVLAFFHVPNSLSLLLILAFNGAAFMLAIAYLVIARGLWHVERWAVAAARPVLVLIVLEDVGVQLTRVIDGHIPLPIATVIAGWALIGPAGVHPIPRPTLFSGAVLVLTAPLLASLVFAKQVFDWGGALDVHQSDLAAQLVASCGPAGGNPGVAAGEPPASIHLAYDWAWKHGSPVPSGVDIVVIGWTGEDAQGRPLYLLGPEAATQPGIYSGRRAFPSLEMGNAMAAASEGSWQWGVVLDERGLAPGHIEVDLTRTRQPGPGAQPLRIVVSYVHLGLWHVDTPVTCEW